MSQHTVLDHGDYIIRDSDMHLLSSTNWLNDTLIGFYFQYLQIQQQQNKTQQMKYPICHFVGPEVTQLLKLTSSADVPEVLTGSDFLDSLANCPYTLFAINDSVEVSLSSQGGIRGSHWSLLVFSQVDKAFVHFDSAAQSNREDAATLVNTLKPYADSAPLKTASKCIQQSNSYDCGCHLIRNAELISEYVAADGGGKKSIYECPTTITITASPEEAASVRTKLKNLICDLSKQV